VGTRRVAVSEKAAITIWAVVNERPRLTPKSRRLATPENGPSTATPEAHTPAAKAATETTRATATTVTVLSREPVAARELCTGREPVKNRGGVYHLPITHNT